MRVHAVFVALPKRYLCTLRRPMLPTRLRCPDCNWTQRCGPTEAIEYLMRSGMLRRNSDPTLEELSELLTAALPRLACPDCGRAGLLEEAADTTGDDGDWPEAKLCEECDAPIHPERLEIFPDARLCTACQRRDETGASNLAEDVYCPRCGSPMLVKPATGRGIARYVWVCSQYPSCRGK